MSYIQCPYCDITVEILEINCGIFRCGMYKHDGKQIDPHLNEDECNKLRDENLIWGCAQPFKIKDGKVEKCDYYLNHA